MTNRSRALQFGMQLDGVRRYPRLARKLVE